MIKRITLHCLYLLLLVACCSSCYKNKYPGCKITTPANEQVFTAGVVVAIAVEMHDDGDALTTENLVVVKQNSSLDTVVNHKQYDFLFRKYILNESFVCESNTRYKILATARGGHGNYKSDSVFIKSN